MEQQNKSLKHPSEWDVLSKSELNAMRVILAMVEKHGLAVAWAEYEIAQAKADLKKAYVNLTLANAQTRHHSCQDLV